MSTLLEQASLVMIPSGYKEDVVYSQIPTSGAGDLSFTRASNGTRINSSGLVEVCPWNLLQQSNTFSNAIWVKNACSIVADVIASPDGTINASKLVENTANDSHHIYQNAVSHGANVYYFYAKRGERNFVYAYADSVAQGKCFDLLNGTVGANIIAAPISASIESVGNDWYKCSITLSLSSGSALRIGVCSANGTFSYLGNGTSGIYIYGAQLNIGSTAKPYFPTTDRLNVPRLTYQNGGGGCPSLLLEKQSTNVETWSEDFSNASWTKTNCSITANTTTSPDGTQNADKIIENSVNGVHFTFNVGATLSVAQTLSVYAKADTRTQLALQLGASSVIYNLSSGTIVSGSGGAIENAGNGWYRCSITTTPANTNALIFTANGGTNSYQGDGTSGLFIWGAQLEASSYLTSYIPTTSSSATRVADACYKTGISSLIGQTEGTILLDWKQNAFNNSQGIYANNYNLTGSISIQMATNGTLQAYVCYAGTFFSISTSANAIQIGQRYKLGFAYKSGDCALYLNGNLIGTNTTSFAFTTTLDEIDLSNRTVFFANLSEISVNELVQSKTRISNADIQSWTA